MNSSGLRGYPKSLSMGIKNGTPFGNPKLRTFRLRVRSRATMRFAPMEGRRDVRLGDDDAAEVLFGQGTSKPAKVIVGAPGQLWPASRTPSSCQTLCAIQCRFGCSTASGSLATAPATGEATEESSVELEIVTAVSDPDLRKRRCCALYNPCGR